MEIMMRVIGGVLNGTPKDYIDGKFKVAAGSMSWSLKVPLDNLGYRK